GAAPSARPCELMVSVDRRGHLVGDRDGVLVDGFAGDHEHSGHRVVLEAGDANLDVKAAADHSHWLKPRVGEFRTLYRAGAGVGGSSAPSTDVTSRRPFARSSQ